MVALALAGSAVWAVDPTGAVERPEYFSISPARRDVVGRPAQGLAPTMVGNTTKETLQVSVTPVLVGQGMTGQFTFSETAAARRAAERIVGATPARFEMVPGSARSVALHWNRLAKHERTAFVGVIFQSKAKAKPGQQVNTIQRLLSVNFLRLPGRYRESGAFTFLRAEQGAAPRSPSAGHRSLIFYPRIRNTGELADSPTGGRLLIRDAAGEVVARRAWTGDVVLPGYRREYGVEVRDVLPAGHYTAIAETDFGHSKRLRIAKRFTLVGPNRLPSPKVAVTGFAGEGEIGGDAHARGVVRSVGTAPAGAEVRVDLFRLLAGGQQPAKPMASRRLTFSGLAPKASKPFDVVYHDLPKAAYRVVATYEESPGVPAEEVSEFTPHEKVSASRKFERWWREHRGLVLGLVAAVLVLALVAFLLLRQRRLVRRLREVEGEAPAVSAADGAPPPDGPLDLNAATREELLAVPGLGPVAVGRILDHRAEHGPFEELEDLAGVPGFDAERVDELRPHLRA